MQPNIITTCVQRKLDGQWSLAVQFDFKPIEHERTKRNYASAEDALTSARHLVKELTKATS